MSAGSIQLRSRSAAPSRADLATALVVLAASVLLGASMKAVNPRFGSIDQIGAILVTSVFLVVAAFGQGLAILLGGIDLSIGVVMSASGVMIAALTNGSDGAMVWAVPLTLATCTAVGVANGVGVAVLRIPPFIVTLAVGTIVNGVVLGLTAGSSQHPVAPALQDVMSGRLHGLPIPILLTLCFLGLATVLQSCTADGRRLYALGSSPSAARVAGLPIVGLTIATYAVSALCAALSGLLLAGYSSSATLDMGDPFLMPTIAAVVIGGARVAGGRGIYLGTFAGAIFLSTLATVITALSLSQGWRNVIQGGIIVAALVLQSDRVRRVSKR
jgi:ribose transport system permease protein